jgi:undecaprenyl-diphosphatase
MLEQLNAIDEWIFTVIHFYLKNSFLDLVVPYIRDARLWIPLYIFILWKVYSMNKKWFVYFILTALILVTLTDQISASLFKPFFERLRPCHDSNLSEIINPLVSCGGQYGFVSSHASNHFGLAVLFSFIFSKIQIKWIKGWYFYVWAGVISLGQVYVGKHFPGDILVGALLGILIGFMMTHFFKKLTLKIDL